MIEDPNEFTNLADNPEHAEMKAQLREKLAALRDGEKWEDFESLPDEEMPAFELLAEVSGAAEFKLGDAVVANVESMEWAPLRIRVAGNRSQVWVDNKVYSDETRPSDIAAGVLTAAGGELRKIRIREL